jgi:hypothetical protein
MCAVIISCHSSGPAQVLVSSPYCAAPACGLSSLAYTRLRLSRVRPPDSVFRGGVRNPSLDPSISQCPQGVLPQPQTSSIPHPFSVLSHVHRRVGLSAPPDIYHFVWLTRLSHRCCIDMSAPWKQTWANGASEYGTTTRTAHTVHEASSLSIPCWQRTSG